MDHIFNDKQLEKAEFIVDNPVARLSDLLPSDIKELSVVWCYYSGKIEGNTYTYVETEALLKDGITSEKRYEDAKMLKNLYNTFVSELEYCRTGFGRRIRLLEKQGSANKRYGICSSERYYGNQTSIEPDTV